MLLISYMCRKITSHWQPLFSKKMAAASFSYKIGGGGKDLAILLVAVLTWSGYWPKNIYLKKHGLISNNFSSNYDILCATRILRVIGRQSIRLYDSL